MHLTITKTFRFEAAHSLPHLPKTHQCHRCHGHSYEVLIAVTGPNLKCGWVQDYSEISVAVSPTIAKLDHQNLNEILPCHTTAENLAIWIVGEIQHLLPMLSRVEVRETPTSNVILDVRSGLMGKFQSPA